MSLERCRYLENVAIACQGIHAFLDSSTTRVLKTNDGSARHHCLIHHFENLLGVGPRKTAAKNSEILTIDENPSSVNRAMPCHDAVARNLFFGPSA